MEVKTSPPEAAVRHLRNNPHLAREFDEYYGEGLAQQFLAGETSGVYEVPTEPSAAPAQAKESHGVISDVAGALVSGPIRAIEAAGDLAAKGAEALGLPAGIKIGSDGISLLSREELNAEGGDVLFGRTETTDNNLIAPRDTTAGKIVEGVTQFLGPWSAIGKLHAGFKAGGLVVSGLRGIAADFVGFGKDDQGSLFDLAEDLGADNPIVQWLSVDTDDTDLEARAKGALGGLIPGVGIDLVFRGLRVWKGARAAAAAAKTEAEAKEAAAAYIAKHADEVKKLNEELQPIYEAHFAHSGSPAGGDFRYRGERLVEGVDEAALLAGQGGSSAGATAAAGVPASPVSKKLAADLPDWYLERAGGSKGGLSTVSDADMEALKANQITVYGTPHKAAPVFGRKPAEVPSPKVDATPQTPAPKPTGELPAKPVQPASKFTDLGSEVEKQMRLIARGDGGIDVDVSNATGLRLINYDRVEAPGALKASMEAMAPVIERKLDVLIKTGRQTHSEIIAAAQRDLSEATGVPARDILRQHINTMEAVTERDLATQLVTSKAYQAALFRDLDELATKELAGATTEADKIRFHNLAELYGEFAAYGKSMQVQAARAVSAGRIRTVTADGRMIPDKLIQERLVPLITAGKDGKIPLKELAAMIKAGGGDAATVGRALVKRHREIHKRGLSHWLAGFYTNALLSGVSSNVWNVIGSATQALILPAERFMGGVIRGDKAQIMAAGDYYVGMVGASIDAIRGMAAAFRVGRPILDPTSEAIDNIADNAFIAAGAWLDRNVISFPTRVLMTGDEFFKQLAYRADLRAALMPEARARFKGDAKGMARWVEEQTAAAFDDTGRGINIRARDYARLATYTKPLESAFGQGVSRALAEHPTLRFFLPVWRTPANILKEVYHRTPLFNLLSKRLREDIAGGGEAANAAIGKIATSGILLAAGSVFATSDRVTGGAPRNPDLRALWEAGGNKPYSIRFTREDGTVGHFNYGKLEPIGSVLGLIKDLTDLSRSTLGNSVDIVEGATKILLGIAMGIEDKTMLRSMVEFTEAFFSGSETRLQRYLSRIGTTMTFWRGTTQATNIASDVFNWDIRDPYFREARDFVDMVQAQIPGWSQDLPVSRNWITGKPSLRPTGGGILPPELNVLNRGDGEPEGSPERIVSAELVNLGYPFQEPSRVLRDVELSAAQHARYLELVAKGRNGGPSLLEDLLRVINSPAYDKERKVFQDPSPENRRFDDDAKRVVMIREVISKHKDKAYRALLAEDEGFRVASRAARLKSRQARRGALKDAETLESLE